MGERLKERLAYLVRLARTTIIASSFGMIVIGAVYVDRHNPIDCRKMAARSFYAGCALIGFVGAATMIHWMVSWINRLHDSRHAKRPPDAP